MRSVIKKIAPLRRTFYRFKGLGRSAQSDEPQILDRLIAAAIPRTFVEFGFHPAEFNCIGLAMTETWQGLLIDGNRHHVDDANVFFGNNIRAISSFLTLDNLDLIRMAFDKLGVLSIDVDGNDYWFLQALIHTRPSVICVEYNSTLGLEPIVVPYDPTFDRNKEHPSGWYHGASLSALAKLCSKHGYGLAAVSEAGGNAFFTEEGTLKPNDAWKPSALRRQYSGCTHTEQWEAIRALSFITV